MLMRKYRKYVFAVVFLRRSDPQFLILHRVKNWKGWELVKGGLLDGENELDGLGREMREETGVKFKLIAKTRHFLRYAFPKGFVKDGHIYHGARGRLFLVEALGRKVRVDRREHDRHMWVSRQEALEILTHKDQRNALNYVCRRYSLC